MWVGAPIEGKRRMQHPDAVRKGRRTGDPAQSSLQRHSRRWSEEECGSSYLDLTMS